MANYNSNSTKSDYSDGKRKITPKMIYDHFEKPAKQSVWALPLLCVMFIITAIIIDHRIISTIFYCLPVVVLVGGIFSYRKTMQMLKNGEFMIITDKVERVAPEEKVKVRLHGNYASVSVQHAIYLEKCGRVLVTYGETNTNSVDDIFYVVVTKTHPTTPLLTYNSKYYELVDLNTEQ